MTKQLKYDWYFMRIAVETANMSYATKKKVGCVIAKDNRIIAAGWNGTPSGCDNVCEYINENGELKTKDDVIHAEMNAIFWCAKQKISTKDATIYVTLSPCKNCALGIIQSDIKRVVYLEEYDSINKSGIELLKKHGIIVEKLSETYN